MKNSSVEEKKILSTNTALLSTDSSPR